MTAAQPNEATQRVEALIRITERLCALITAEADALTAERPGELAVTAEERAELAALYARHMAALGRDRAQISGADPGALAVLHAGTVALRTAAAEHAQCLARRRQVTEGLVQTLAETVNGQLNRALGYDGQATWRPAPAAALAALAVNHKASELPKGGRPSDAALQMKGGGPLRRASAA